MTVSQAGNDSIELRDYLAVLWRHRRLVVAVATVITLLGTVFTLLLPRVFESQAVIRLRVLDVSANSPITFLDAAPMAGVITTPFFIDAAARDAGIAAPTSSLIRGVQVRTIAGRIVWLRVRHTDPAMAQALNAALVQAFISQVGAEVQPRREAVAAHLREVEAQRAETEQIIQQSRQLLRATDAFSRSFALNAMSNAGVVLQRLSEERRDLKLQLLAFTLPAVVTGPNMPEAPMSTPLARNVILAGLLGAAAAAAAAFAVEYVRPSRVPVPLAPEAATAGRGGRQTG